MRPDLASPISPHISNINSSENPNIASSVFCSSSENSTGFFILAPTSHIVWATRKNREIWNSQEIKQLPMALYKVREQTTQIANISDLKNKEMSNWVLLAWWISHSCRLFGQIGWDRVSDKVEQYVHCCKYLGKIIFSVPYNHGIRNSRWFSMQCRYFTVFNCIILPSDCWASPGNRNRVRWHWMPSIMGAVRSLCCSIRGHCSARCRPEAGRMRPRTWLMSHT